jgi:hypothetical protein
VSLAIALGMGYLLASALHNTHDGIGILVYFLVGLGACTKVGLWIVFSES